MPKRKEEPLINDAFSEPQSPEQIATEQPEAPKRRGRPKGSKNKTSGTALRTGKFANDLLALTQAVNRGLAAMFPAKSMYMLNTGLYPSESGDVQYDERRDEEKALSFALAGEINASPKLQKIFAKAATVSPHIVLAQVLISLTINRVIIYNQEKAKIAASKRNDVPNPVPLEDWGTYGGNRGNGNGENVSRVAFTQE